LKAELVLGNLIKLRFVREINEERKHQTGENSYEYYNVRVLKAERGGIQYLIDNNLITPEQLKLER